ncbi:AP-4 complex accessory subunit RUSC1-like [Leucoraja erinacea]|uniref:AP-4 complex accessory subunit RUSC1-like n=1 Tax=Leucoraja erinaceus TaxID=7782 RepID=UPI002453E036|nr:AP-4 complex accessory subunit RUSC1-like [Leucoraja erinacea]
MRWRGDRTVTLSLCPCLVWAVSASVEDIIGHFSTARNIVQKCERGNSGLTPSVGGLLLGGLCRALGGLLGDGLYPSRPDPVLGRRPNSAWTVVGAAASSDRSRGDVYTVYRRLDRESQLHGPQTKLNAFIFTVLK